MSGAWQFSIFRFFLCSTFIVFAQRVSLSACASFVLLSLILISFHTMLCNLMPSLIRRITKVIEFHREKPQNPIISINLHMKYIYVIMNWTALPAIDYSMWLLTPAQHAFLSLLHLEYLQLLYQGFLFLFHRRLSRLCCYFMELFRNFSLFFFGCIVNFLTYTRE